MLDLLFPPRCVACDEPISTAVDGIMLCRECRVAVLPSRLPGCRRCGAFGPEDGSSNCLSCKEFSLVFDTVAPLGHYDGRLREHVLETKRPSGAPLAAALGGLLAVTRRDALTACRADCVVPVPMYWPRRMGRATNGPDTIAKSIGILTNLPVRAGWLRRQRSTLPQANLKPRARFQNVRGAFATRKGLNLKGLRVLLVDDVLTTGATASEAARTLKAAGAAFVAVAVIARADGRDAT